jgi:hypothetical protein
MVSGDIAKATSDAVWAKRRPQLAPPDALFQTRWWFGLLQLRFGGGRESPTADANIDFVRRVCSTSLLWGIPACPGANLETIA